MKHIIIPFLILGTLSGCSYKEDTPTPPPEKQEVIKRTEDLFSAIYKEDVDSVRHYVTKADLQGYDPEGKTPLMRAVLQNHATIVEVLIKHGSLVFQTEENDVSETAYLKINEGNTEIKRIFDKEIKRLAGVLESHLQSQDYDTATVFKTKNYLPYDIKLSKGYTPLVYVVKNTPEPSQKATEYVFQDLSFYSLDEILDLNLYKDLNKFSTNGNSEKLYEAVVIKTGSNKKAVGAIRVFNGAETLPWLKSKLSVMKKHGIHPDSESFTTKMKTHIDSLSTADTELFLSVISLFFQTVDTEEIYANHRSSEMLLDILNKSLTAHNGLNTFNKSLESSKQSGMLIFLHDSFLTVVKGDLEKPIDTSIMKESIAALTLGSADGKVSEGKALTFLLNDYPKGGKRTELISYLISKSRELPDNFIEQVISNDIALLNTVLDSGLEIDSWDGSKAVTTAVAHSANGEDAKSVLISLKEHGVSLTTKESYKSLFEAYKKVWSGDDTYISVVDFFLNESKDHFKKMGFNTKLSLIKNHCLHIRKSKKNWSMLHDLLELSANIEEQVEHYDFWDQSDRENALIYETNVNNPGEPSEITIVPPMDIILSLFEVYLEDKSTIGSISSLVTKTLRVFENEDRSLEFKPGVLDQKTFITHNLLSLSILLSLSPDQILEQNSSLSSSDLEKWNNETFLWSKKERVPLIKWHTFVTSNFYEYYSVERDFWSSISKDVLKQGRSIPVIDNLTFDKMYRLIIRNGLLEESNSFADSAYLLPDGNHYENSACIIQKSSQFEGKIMAPLGSFEIFTPILEKSCVGAEKVTSQEIKFLQQYIKYQLKAPSGWNSASGNTYYESKKDVTFLDFFNIQNKNYGGAYTATGILTPHNSVAIEKGFSTDSNPIMTNFDIFDFYVPAPMLQYRAKLSFLKILYHCSESNGDNDLKSTLDSISSEHQFIGHASVDMVGLCRQETN